MTNAHVAGTRVGRVVDVEVESQGNERIQARIVAAAYSDRVSSDWALLETLEPYTKVKPVKLSKNPPSGSHYTKGFPRCRPHNGTDIETVEVRNGVWFWEPDAIGGQSGSGVWSDGIERQEGLLTWQWGGHGAGQPTSAIYGQMRSQTNAGVPRPDGLVELENDYDLEGVDRDGMEDPIVEVGYFAEMTIQDFPIWWDADAPKDPDDPNQPNEPVGNWLESQIQSQRRRAEFESDELVRLESQLVLDTKPVDPDKIPDGGGSVFGLMLAIILSLLPISAIASGPIHGLGNPDPVQPSVVEASSQQCQNGVCKKEPTVDASVAEPLGTEIFEAPVDTTIEIEIEFDEPSPVVEVQPVETVVSQPVHESAVETVLVDHVWVDPAPVCHSYPQIVSVPLQTPIIARQSASCGICRRPSVRFFQPLRRSGRSYRPVRQFVNVVRQVGFWRQFQRRTSRRSCR